MLTNRIRSSLCAAVFLALACGNADDPGGAGGKGVGGSGTSSGGATGAGATGGSGGAAGTGGSSGTGATAGTGGAGTGGVAGQGGTGGAGASGGSSGKGGSAGSTGGASGAGGATMPDGSAGGTSQDAAADADAGRPAVDASSRDAADARSTDGSPADASSEGSNGDDGPPNRKPCTSSFGSGLTQAFGRIDGYLSAVIIPNQATCKPDNDHVYLQISMNNATYQIAVNVFSNQGDGGVPSQVLYLEKALTSLPDGAWAEGWHTGSSVTFDYVNNVSVHAADFTATPLQMLAQTIADRLVNVNHISVFGTGYGPDGADLIHRNGSSHDGAIVTEPLSATPHALMFHFSNQSF